MGLYVEIVDVNVPQAAPPGSSVQPVVSLKNSFSSPLQIGPTGAVMPDAIELYGMTTTVQPGATAAFAMSSFVMPNHAVEVTIYAFFWSGVSWVLDETRVYRILLQETGEVNIISSTIPDKAKQGASVAISLVVKNTFPTAKSVYVHSYISQGSLVMTPSETIIQPGAQATFTTSFVMPGNDVAVGFAPAYKVDDTWLVGTGISKTIALEVEEPPEVPPEAPTFSEFAISGYRVLAG